MSDTSPITKEELLTAITSALAVIRPEFDDPAYSASNLPKNWKPRL